MFVEIWEKGIIYTYSCIMGRSDFAKCASISKDKKVKLLMAKLEARFTYIIIQRNKGPPLKNKTIHYFCINNKDSKSTDSINKQQ